MDQQRHPLDRITRLEIAVFGWTGNNGLRGQVADNSRRLASLEALLAQALTVARTGRWIALGLGGGLAFLGAERVGAALAWTIRAMIGP